MLDRTKMSPGLSPQRVWVPERGSDQGERSIVYVTERRRRVIGAIVIGLSLVVAIAIRVANAPAGLLLLAFAITVIGGAYAAGGRAGFYEVADDGSLGEFLGKSKPELGSMRGMRVP